MSSLDNEIDGFICGLVCGEGNFAILFTKNDACGQGYSVRAMFQMELDIKDLPLLEMVRNHLGVGGIYFPSPSRRNRIDSPTARYWVAAILDCCRLVDFFKCHRLRGIKQDAFEIWAECVEIIRQGEHLGSDGFMRIAKLREGMNQHKRPSTRREQEMIAKTAHEISERRMLAVWDDAEVTLVQSYVKGEIQHAELEKAIHRSPASLANKITRVRKQLRSAQQGL
jgi:hypothetical protein